MSEYEGNVETNSDYSSEFKDESVHQEAMARPAAGGTPQPTVGGAPPHTATSKKGQTERFSFPMSTAHVHDI